MSSNDESDSNKNRHQNPSEPIFPIRTHYISLFTFQFSVFSLLGTISAYNNNMKRLILIVVIVMTAMSCNAQSNINRATVASLDVNRYMGRWYEIARYDHSFERNMEYCKAQYTLMPDGKILVENSGVDSRTGKFRIADGKAKLGDHPGQLRVSFFWIFYSDYNILEMGEHGEWVLVGSRSPQYLWILSRTPSLPEQTLNEIMERAEQRGYNTEKLIIDNGD